MAAINGSDMLIYSGSSGSWAPIAHATSHTLNITQATRDTSNKTTGKWIAKATGRLDVNGSAEGFAVHDSAWGFEKLMNLVIERQTVKLLFADKTSETDQSPLTGSEFYGSGSFIFTNFDITAGSEENSAYSCTFELSDGGFGLFNK